MGRVATNNISLSYTIEPAIGVAGAEWNLLEPNDISTFGATITTVARDPISKNRQRRKGTVTDLDSSVEFASDTTLSAFRDFAQGFAFATAINADVVQLDATAAETTGDSYTGLTALTAAQADKFEIDTLIWVTGGNNPANNGLKTVDADIAAAATAISVAENLVDETAAFKVSFAGFRVAAGDTVTWTWDGVSAQATMASTGLGTELAALGLTAGAVVHIGSITELGNPTIQNAFENSVANDMFGYARVVSIAAGVIVFDKVDLALQFTDSTDPATPIDILFGEFIRNVTVDDPAYLEQSFQFEAEFVGLQNPSGDEYQYSLGNYCNTMAIELPLTDKSTITYGFVGTDTEVPTTSRKTGADSAAVPGQVQAFNTTADIARLRVTRVDEVGLSTDFKSVTLTLNNNVTPEKVIGTLGGKFINVGNFNVDLQAQMIFSEGDVIDAIRGNTTVTMDFILKNEDGVLAIDIPALTLGGGGRTYPRNETVLVDITGEAFADPALNTSIGISIIHVPLP